MSLEAKIEALTVAVEANTAALAKIIAGGAPSAGAAAAEPEKATRTRRSRDTEEKAPAESKVTLDEVKAAANKFLDVGDDEYDARVKAVFEPIFAKAKSDSLSTLNSEFYGAVLDGIAGYKPASTRRAI